MGLVAEIVDNRWQPGIGDPTLLGWLTVVAYALALVLCVMAFRNAGTIAGGRAEGLWAVLACLMLGLGINKQLDLQTWFTQVGRDLAIRQGWYAGRQAYQGAFILLIALGGLVMIAASSWLAIRNRWPIMPLVGAASLVGYVVVRAASFHHVDRIINLSIPGARLSSVIELVGIAIIGVSARKALAIPPKPGPGPKSLVEIVSKFR